MLFHGVLKLSLQPPESAEQTFRWAWCCGNGGQNGLHLRDLVQRVFSYNASMTSAVVFIDFSRCIFLNRLNRCWSTWSSSLSKLYSNQQLDQSNHWRENHFYWRHLTHKEHLDLLPLPPSKFFTFSWTFKVHGAHKESNQFQWTLMRTRQNVSPLSPRNWGEN